MADWIDFLPLYVRTEDDIRADMDADANAGLDPIDPDWVDIRPVSFFHMVTQPFVIEAARIHDYISTLPAVGFIEFAYGQYLDYHAADFNDERKAALYATGYELFRGPPGTLITADTQVSTAQTDENVPPIVFATTQSATINGPLGPPTGVTATLGSGGSLAAGSRYYKVAAYDAAGQTLSSTEVSATVGGGGGGKITLAWDPVADATGYWVYVGTTPGGENQAIQLTTTGLVDDGTLLWGAGVVPTANTTGGAALVPIQAQQVGSGSNVAANALTEMVTTNQAVTSLTNPQPCDNGADVESDPALRERLLAERSGEGPGTMADYTRWVLDWPGVSRVQVIPLYNGPGTVGVVIMDLEGNPLSAATASALQASLDPYPGLGGGTAPIDHIVYAVVPTLVTVAVTATITFGTGFSLDGASNTVPTRQAITDALNAYFQALNCGDIVQVDKIKAAIYSVEGVATVTLAAPAADVPTSINPPTRGALGALALS